jgi:hypothetical protein
VIRCWRRVERLREKGCEMCVGWDRERLYKNHSLMLADRQNQVA